MRLGEAATLTVRLQGTGNLQGVREPQVKMLDGLTVHPPQQEGKEEVAGGQVRGSRTWKYAVVPERAGRYTLDTPEITYFDPAAGRYRVAATPDLPLAALPRPQAAKTGNGEQPHGIRNAASSRAGFAGAAWPRMLPWLFLLPWGLAVAVTLVRRRSQVETAAMQHGAGFEEKLREAEAEERPRHAALRIEEAWRQALAERWGVPVDTPPGRWRAALAARKIPPEALEDLERLLEDLQYLRHAPQLSAAGALRAEVLDRSRRLLRRMS